MGFTSVDVALPSFVREWPRTREKMSRWQTTKIAGVFSQAARRGALAAWCRRKGCCRRVRG